MSGQKHPKRGRIGDKPLPPSTLPPEYPFRLIPGRHRDRVLARYLASIDLPHLIDDIEHTSAELLDDEDASLSILQHHPPPPPPPLPPTDFLAGAAFLREAAYILEDKAEQKDKALREERKKFLLYNATKKEILKEGKDFGDDDSMEDRKDFAVGLLISTMMDRKT